jgi:pyruvate dehydrogenase kinase 2/3/4
MRLQVHLKPQTVVTLKQLLQFHSSPTKESVHNAAKFLHREVPIRLLNRHSDMQILPKHILRDITSVQRLSKRFHQLHDKITSTSPDNLENFTNELQSCREELDNCVDDAMQSMHQKIALDNVEVDPNVIDLVLDRIQLTVIALRVLIAQYQLSYDFVNGALDAPRLVVNPHCKLGELVSCVVEDTQAFSIDKNGDAPQVEITGDATMICIESHLHFMLREILKNSMRAMIDKKQEKPIQLLISSTHNQVGIRISDTGGGIPTPKLEHIFQYFYSTAAKFQPTYTYSGDFGAKFDGLGVGLPIARQYARYMCGNIAVQSVPGYGTDTYIYLNKQGRTSE